MLCKARSLVRPCRGGGGGVMLVLGGVGGGEGGEKKGRNTCWRSV